MSNNNDEIRYLPAYTADEAPRTPIACVERTGPDFVVIGQHVVSAPGADR